MSKKFKQFKSLIISENIRKREVSKIDICRATVKQFRSFEFRMSDIIIYLSFAHVSISAEFEVRSYHEINLIGISVPIFRRSS